MRTLFVLSKSLACAGILTLALSRPTFADTYTVTSTNDTGAGSFRQAILDANAHENDLFFNDEIVFNIVGSGPHIIAPASPLPSITDAVEISGDTSGSITNGFVIQLDGANAGADADGLRFESFGSQVSGLAITRFDGAAIRMFQGGLNTVIACVIGVDATGTNAAGNGIGIEIEDSSENAVNANIIAHSTGAGVAVVSGDKNTISENFIFANGGLGIDLSNDGVTANDAGDADAGANALQNFPVLTNAASDGVNTIIQGSLNSVPDTEFLIEFFSNAGCDTSGHGEAEESVGALFQLTDGSGDLTLDTSLPISVPAGRFLTAIATRLDEFGFPTDTSEFSACVQVQAASNNAPMAVYDEFEAVQDAPLSVPAPGVLANDTDPDTNDTLTAMLVTGPSHASSFVLNPDGSFDYTPDTGYAGSDFFTYQASDGTSSSLETTVAILIGATTPEGTNVTVNLTTQILGIELDVTVTFSNVTTAGLTRITPIDPASIGQLPPGYDVFNDEVFDIHTTAIYEGPITVCFSLPGLDDPQLFDLLRVLHEELGVWEDVTVLPGGFASGTICGQVDSLSPFALAFVMFPPGDVNGDFHVTGADSLLINQVLVGLRSNTHPIFASAGFSNGDINQNQTVSGADSLLINQVVVGLRPFVVTKIVTSTRGNSDIATSVTIFGVGFPTNGTISEVRIGPPVDLPLTDVQVVSREMITGIVPPGGGAGTGVVSVAAASTNGVLSFGRFINP
jgi:hypothetical protein